MDLKEISFTSDLIKTDVTALKVLINDVILIGIGHVAYLYNLSSQQFISKTNVFVGQKIHGFVPNNRNNLIVIFGGKKATIFSLDTISSDSTNPIKEKLSFFPTNKHLNCPDWIMNLIWIKNETRIAILTAHNVVQEWDTTSNSIAILHECEEKCILYSGLLVEINNYVLAMAGTAFSQVVLWSTKCEQVLHRIKGHKGVIFSICYNKDKNIIVTTSDDRSIRIWSLISSNQVAVESLEYWQSVNIESQVNLFGHTARVISSTILDDVILSIGEDAIMCAWDLDGTLLRKKKVIQNGGLWCLDYDKKHNYIITGGSNSGVVLHPEFYTSPTPKYNSINFQDQRLTAKKIALTARGNIVCITEQGYVMYYDFEMEEWYIKHEISYAKTYLCMSISLCRQFVALAGVNGQLDVFVEPCKFDPNLTHFISQKISDNILSLHWVTNRFLVVCDNKGEISLRCSQNQLCVSISTFNLPKCKERWLTAAALEPNNKIHLLVGDRCGNLHLFEKGNMDPLVTLQKIHGRLGINSIEFYKDYIITTGRDGSIKYFTLLVDTNEKTQMLKCMYHVKLPFEWVESFIDREKNIVCGFQETNLIIWDIKEQNNLVSVNCGGGHRSWDVAKCWQEYDNTLQGIFRFVFIKNSVVQVVNTKFQGLSSNSIVRGFHSKEINTLQTILQDCGDFYLISAGEDTSISITLCKTENRNVSFEKLFDLTNHLSSIRCTCLIKLKHIETSETVDEFILYSAGGRAQICMSKLSVIKLENEHKIKCQNLGSYMLKGTDFERKKKEGAAYKHITDIDGETRFMSLNYINLNNNITSNSLSNNFLLAGCSDGFLRVYKTKVEENKCELSLSLSLEHHKRCILKVHSFILNNRHVVLTFAVNGCVAFWDFTQYVNNSSEETINIKPFCELKIHKAGINCVDLNIIDDNRIILATGGDDNAIHLNIFKINELENELTVEKVSQWSSDGYHCSQVTGIKLFDDIIISASIDQRITLMKWSASDQLSCEYFGQYHSTVPDLQGFDVIKYARDEITICVFGKGIEIITASLK